MDALLGDADVRLPNFFDGAEGLRRLDRPSSCLIVRVVDYDTVTYHDGLGGLPVSDLADGGGQETRLQGEGEYVTSGGRRACTMPNKSSSR